MSYHSTSSTQSALPATIESVDSARRIRSANLTLIWLGIIGLCFGLDYVRRGQSFAATVVILCVVMDFVAVWGLRRAR